MSNVVTVTTGSRLHFGPLAWQPRTGRDFGGWGVMLETPRCVLRAGEIIPSPKLAGTPLDDAQHRAERVLDSLRNRPAFSVPASMTVDVIEVPPPHCGLGSGTQLSLAVARVAAHLQCLPSATAVELAGSVNRGARSAVGIHGFDLGGLVVDAGKRSPEDIGQLATRLPFPETWRFLLIRPAGNSGLMGDTEAAAFGTLPSFSESVTARLSRLLLTEILPAVQSTDFNTFATALTAYGQTVGEAFSSCQQGVVHPASMSLWNELHRQHVKGIAQTSWGPTLAIACSSDDDAQRWQDDVTRFDSSTETTITRVRNTGATLDLDSR